MLVFLLHRARKYIDSVEEVHLTVDTDNQYPSDKLQNSNSGITVSSCTMRKQNHMLVPIICKYFPH